MKISNKIYNGLIAGAFLLVLWLPYIQCQHHIPDVKMGLAGVGFSVTEPKLSWRSFRDMSYQDQMDLFAKEHIGYWDYLVRLYDQIDYSLFGILRGNLVRGRDGFLFGTDYIYQYTGTDCLDSANWSDMATKFKRFQDSLSVRNTIVTFIIDPGKASFDADKLPSKYRAMRKPVNNYIRLRQQLTLKKCNFIDFHEWFDSLKPHSPARLFPRVGTHWTLYGGALALDSMVHYMEACRGIRLKRFSLSAGPKEKPHTWLDTDLRDLTNLLFEFKADSLSYPVYTYTSEDSDEYCKPRILVIADSYFTAIHLSTDLYRIFDSQSRIWDYNKTEYDLRGTATWGNVDPIRLENYDFVFIMTSESNYGHFDFGISDSYLKVKR